MILTAESGWSFGEWGYGEDKKAELQRAIDEHRAEMGLEPVDWSESAEPKALDDEADEATSAETRDPPSRNSRESGNAASSPQDKPGPRLRRV
jgi:hypothetical protein